MVPATPARWSAWVRHEKPSARKTSRARRRAGRAAARSRRPRPTRRSGPSPCRSCRPARSSPRAPRTARRRRVSRRRSAVHAHHRVVVAVRLHDRGRRRTGPATCQRSPGPMGAGAVSSSASVRVARPPRAGARGRRAAGRRRSERSTAVHDGSSPTIGIPLTANGPSTPSRWRQPPPGAVELAGADPGEAAAGVVRRAPAPRTRRRPAPSTAACAHGRREGVGERVGPEHAPAAASPVRRLPASGTGSPGAAPVAATTPWRRPTSPRTTRGTGVGERHHRRRVSMPPPASTALATAGCRGRALVSAASPGHR